MSESISVAWWRRARRWFTFRLWRSVWVNDFGAHGDAKTDDSLAISEAMAYGEGGVTLKFRQGRYVVNRCFNPSVNAITGSLAK